MVTADDVRAVGLALPRAYERMVRGRWKLRVGQIVFAAFSKDETDMGFGFPKAERDGLIASDPGDVLPAADRATCATSGSAPTSTGSTSRRCASW